MPSSIESANHPDELDMAIPLRGTSAAQVAEWTATIPRRGTGQADVPLAPARELLLTFDDGPDMHVTPFVLAELEKRGLQAIFFVVGHRLIAKGERGRIQRALAQEIVRRGHLIGNHTVWHRHLCDHPERIPAEIDGNDEIIQAVTGVRPVLFRAPFGDKCPELDLALRGRGLVDVGWSIDPQDWRRRDPVEIAAYVRDYLERLPHRAILLLHDSRRAGALALPAILDFVAAENQRAAEGRARPIRIADYSALFRAPTPPTTKADALALAR